MVVTKHPRTFCVALSTMDRQLLDALASYEERRPGDALRVARREAARRRGLLDGSPERADTPAQRTEWQGTKG